MVDRFTRSYSIEDLARLGTPIGRNDDIDAIADRFYRGKSKQTFGGSIPAGNGTVKHLCDDGIIG